MPWRKETKYKEFFYRYRNFDNDRCCQSLELLFLKNTIHLASPLTFNDPFDCRPHYFFDATEREIKTYLKNMFKENAKGLTKNDINRQVTKILNHVSRQGLEFGDLFNEQFDMLLQTVGMVCFSKIPDNILMWSHYASSHTGICIQLEGNVQVDSFLLFTQKVEYSKDFPVINPVKTSNEEKLSKGLLTKASEWEYEQEYRVILPATQKTVSFPDEALTSVIFGLKTKPEHKEFINNLILKRKRKPALYQAVMKRCEYGLDFVPVRYE